MTGRVPAVVTWQVAALFMAALFVVAAAVVAVVLVELRRERADLRKACADLVAVRQDCYTLRATNRGLAFRHAEAQVGLLKARVAYEQLRMQTRDVNVDPAARFAANMGRWLSLDAVDCPPAERGGERS